jgi:hypothetical protein
MLLGLINVVKAVFFIPENLAFWSKVSFKVTDSVVFPNTKPHINQIAKDKTMHFAPFFTCKCKDFCPPLQQVTAHNVNRA